MVAEAGNKALEFVKSKWFIYGLIAVIVIFLIWKYQARIRQFFSKDNGDYTLGIGDTETTQATQEEKEQRKQFLRQLAEATYAAIHGIPVNYYGIELTDRVSLFKQMLALNDSELKFLANYYSVISKDETLYEAIDDEFMPFNNEDDKLLARLSKLNEA